MTLKKRMQDAVDGLCLGCDYQGGACTVRAVSDRDAWLAEIGTFACIPVMGFDGTCEVATVKIDSKLAQVIVTDSVYDSVEVSPT